MRCRSFARRSNAHVDLVGEDTLGGELQKHAAEIGVGAHVTFHGFLPQPGVLEIVSRSDLYVQSSLHEAAGVSVLEAAAAGVPDGRHARGLRGGLVADESDGARRRDSRIARRRHPGAARRCRSPAIDGGAGARVRDRARRLVVGRAVRSAVPGACSPRPSSSAAGSSCRRSAGTSRCARRQATA